MSSVMSDEDFYLKATEEAEGNNRNEALWAKSMALTEGDHEQAKYKYINYRVEQLKEELKAEQKKNRGPDGYMPIEEFIAYKGIGEDVIIKRIKDGFYSGKIKNGKWFVHRQEVQPGDTSSYSQHKDVANSQKPSNKGARLFWVFVNIVALWFANVYFNLKYQYFKEYDFDLSYFIKYFSIADSQTIASSFAEGAGSLIAALFIGLFGLFYRKDRMVGFFLAAWGGFILIVYSSYLR